MTMMNIHKIVLESLFLLLLTSCTTTSSNAFEEDQRNNNNNNNNIQSDIGNNPLGRFLVRRFLHQNKEPNKKFSSLWSETNIESGELRRLGDDNNNNNNDNNKIKEGFGPGTDWSCTAKGAINFDSCVQQEESAGAGADEDDASSSSSSSCAWCPFGSTNGICLRTDQANLVNGLENDHLLHLKCYNNNIEQEQEQEQLHSDVETITKFWDEAIACHPHNSNSCAGDHHGDHVCTWCTVNEPAMGMCISQSLYENLVVAQALEEFDNDVSTNDQIRIDQVIHCGDGDGDGDDDNDGVGYSGSSNSSSTSTSNNDTVSSLWDTTTMCGLSSLDDCILTRDDNGDGSESCVVQTNPFPGLLGFAAGKYCVTHQQQRFILWMVELLRDMGWEKEMSPY